MKHVLIVIILSTVCLLSAQEFINYVPEGVPRGMNPVIPTQAALDALPLLELSQLDEQKKDLGKGRYQRIYFFNEELFSGWVIQLFEDSDHRFRYIKIANGGIVWQIGYYENGDIDLDFHGFGSENYGSQRMWGLANEPYINTYFLEDGIQHGMQYRWYADHQPAAVYQYDNGNLVFKIEYNEDGSIKKKTGEIPPAYSSCQ